MKYESKIIEVGELSGEMLSGGMLILFSENVPKELREYCIVHKNDIKLENIKEGYIVEIGEKKFTVTSVGEIALKNWQDLGHVTLKFDDKKESELPGIINLKGKICELPRVGESIKVSEK